MNRLEVVDIDVDPLAERTRRRRTLLRIGMPLCGVGLIIGFLLGIAIYAERANREGVLGLSDTLLQSLRDRIALQVSAYLEPATHAVLLAHSMLGRDGTTLRSEEAFSFAASVLGQTPQITNVLFADSAGDFMLVTRAPGGKGGTETKRITTHPSRAVSWTTRDAAGQETARRVEPADTYDARTRGWFIGARKSDDVFWTSPYIFFTERAPGVTVAVHGPDADPDVVGVDIRLDALSSFLRGLVIGRTGKAYLVARNGDVVAGPDASRVLLVQNGQPKPASVSEVGDPALTASWDHFRVQGIGTRVIEAGGERLISIVTPLSGRMQAGGDDAPAGQDWLLAITVPESDFSGFVLANSRRAGLLSLVVVALAAGLGALLVRQGMRADRADRAVAERSEAVRLQGAAFARLAAEAGGIGPDGAPPEALTEILAGATGARRASLWQVSAALQSLRCRDSFEATTGGHVAGLELSREEVPALMDALAAGAELDVPDARRDRRTASLHAVLMAPFGSASLFVVPVVKAGPAGPRVLGLVMLEDAKRDPAARDLTRACATLLAMREITAAETLQAAPAGNPAPAYAAADRIALLDGRGMDATLASQTAVDARSIDRAVVLVVRLPAAALARGPATRTLGHQVACAAQDVAAAQGIPYVKMLGCTIVAAAGPVFDPPGHERTNDAATRLAEAAIALRERCAALFDDEEANEDGQATFALGLDSGLVLAGLLGEAPGLFNIWGEALEGARAAAESAPDGTVQTTEAAYLLLRQSFLFRPRGLFHCPGFGDARSYVLGGRA